MLSVARYYRSMKEIYQLLKLNPEITSQLEHFGNLDQFFNNEKLFNLFAAFESRTFDGEASYFFQRGNVLFSWRQLESAEVQKEFAKAIQAIAEIDTVTGLATLFQEFEGSAGATYCFPTIDSSSDTPFISISDGWHPVVGKASVLNSIDLGGATDNPNIIVSGPNAGGKSTALRTITTAAIMFQSMGIAPARKMHTTIYSYIESLMHSEDAVGSESLFQKQVSTANKIIRNLRNLPPHQFGLVAMDESFNGTNPTEGAAFAYGTAEALGQIPNNITMFATHFSNVCELERNTEGRFKNYQVTLNDKGESTYKLVPGSSDQRVAVQVAQKLDFDDVALTAVIKERERLQRQGIA